MPLRLGDENVYMNTLVWIWVHKQNYNLAKDF